MSAVRVSEVEAAYAGPIVVTPMRRRHLRSVLRIEGKNTMKGWSLGLFMSELSFHESRIYLVAKSGSRVIGFAGLLFAGDDGHVTTVSVDPDWKQRRIATRLMLVLTSRAVDRGAEALTLEVRPSNASAIALYQRFGFVPVGARKNYYRESNEDALVMWATDVQSPEYAARLEAIAAELPTATIEEEWGA
jgi:ribosomal-protein-alanine N-acetyltransferase